MIQQVMQPEIMAFLYRGLLTTLYIAVVSIALSFIFGTILGIMRFSRNKILAPISAVYIEIVRNIPLLLFILVMFFISRMKAVDSAIAGLTVFTSAIIAEIVRGGLNSIDKGQWEAAHSQGLSYFQIMRHIILPQAIRHMIPPLVSQFITVVKDTSFVWYIAGEDLTGRGMIILGKYGSSTTVVFALFGLIALTYFVINYSLSILARYLQRRLAGRSY